MAVLFDLDGTLTDPQPGIVGCVRHALEGMGASYDGDLDWCIGPPLGPSFGLILGTDDPATVAEALRLYRERFAAVGLYENRVYDGVPECLARLREAGLPLYVATSKPLVFARTILDHFGLAPYFDGVYGSELDGRLSLKGDLIAHLLERERPSAPIMAGDREHDVIGARQNGVPCIGATYGYGSPEELDEAGAVILCDSPAAVAEAALTLRDTLGLTCGYGP